MNFKVAKHIRNLRNSARSQSNGRGKAPAYIVINVPNLGEIAAGKVVPFIPKSELVAVVVPEGTQPGDIATLTVRGISLSDAGIYDGDILLVRRRFSWRQITDNTVCAVYIHSTGELVAKKIIRGANTLFLRASGGGIPDKEVSPDDIEIRGIVFAVQRAIEDFA